MLQSAHYINDRQTREALIKEIGYGKQIRQFTIDKGHPNGAEIHTLSDTGIYTVYNARTLKMVTRWVARVGQVKRFYENGTTPEDILRIAKEHERLGYNNI